MIFQIIEENGVKKIQALTADTGAGAPVGSFIYMYKKSSPSGYLYCDGSTFDQTKYPALYQYLGSNVLPDYRECVAVGAEQNTTDTIESHDVYTEGQFKDDQLQDHNHQEWATDYQASTQANGLVASTSAPTYKVEKDWNVLNARIGTTTHGKQKAVFIYIKATSGLTENQQENVLNTINENLSYSTTEHKTGKKWIDGKPIYRKVTRSTNALNLNNIQYQDSGAPMPLNFENIIKVEGAVSFQNYFYYDYTHNTLYIAGIGNISIPAGIDFIFEYTKTTDN